MATFTYKARDMNGLLVVGKLDADAIDPVKEKLAEKGLIPIQVTKGSAALSQGISLDIFKRVSTEELMLFTKQFHTLFKAGMDMETLLSTLSKQVSNQYFKDVIERIKSDVASGSSIARAFSQHPKVFDELYTNMLGTGEEAGLLDQVLEKLSRLIEKEMQLKQAVKSAMLYPKIVVFVLAIATTVLMTFVVPEFIQFFGHFGHELPLPTRILIATSSFFTNYWYLLIIGGAAAIFAFKKWVSTAKGRLLFDRLKWKMPVFGTLGKKVANARFANILASLYKAGLPVTRALEITAQTMGHEDFCRQILMVKSDVEKGRGIAEAMRDKKYFSPLIIESTAIGERSGALDDMYFAISQHYDDEVQQMLKNLTTLIEPILLFFVFGMVGGFALAIFLPMWDMTSAVM